MQKIKLNVEKDEKKIIISRIIRQFSSSNINLLIGSGFSRPFLDTLTDVEMKLTKAIDDNDEVEEKRLKREFFNKCIYPIIKLDKKSSDFNDKVTFVKILADIVLFREASTLHKILNIFTTNYDNIIELALEDCNIDYVDGFSGRVKPTFSTSNYGKIICKQSNVSGRTSELVTANLYKLHGSLYWEQNEDKIIFGDYERRLDNIGIASETDFIEKYNSNLLIINPTKDKFQKTLLNENYYDQLRMFSNELEKNSTVIIAFGFSFADEHMLQMVHRALKTNPTLSLLLFPFSALDLKNFEVIFKNDNNVLCYYEEIEEEIIEFPLEKLNKLMGEIYYGIK